jgi:hypothetical protein
MSVTATRTCPLCEATCGLELTLSDGRVERIRGDELLAAMNRIAVRAAVVTAQDPAAAIAHLRAQHGAGGKGLDALPAELLAVMPFVVSRGHLAIRRRLGIGVRA